MDGSWSSDLFFGRKIFILISREPFKLVHLLSFPNWSHHFQNGKHSKKILCILLKSFWWPNLTVIYNVWSAQCLRWWSVDLLLYGQLNSYSRTLIQNFEFLINNGLRLNLALSFLCVLFYVISHSIYYFPSCNWHIFWPTSALHLDTSSCMK